MRDHLPEISPFRWVIAASDICISLIVADWPLHYIIQNFKQFPPEISTTQLASFPLGWMPLGRMNDERCLVIAGARLVCLSRVRHEEPSNVILSQADH